MAKNVNSKTSKASGSGKGGLKSPIKSSKVEATKLGPGGGVGTGDWRLAGNHNETLLR